MVFGSDKNNEIHWKRLSDNNSQELEQSFRDGLSDHLEISWEQWQRYWKEMTDFRNKFAAHRDAQYMEPVPNFDIALRVAYYYDDWVRDIIAPDTFEEPLLSASATNLSLSVRPLVEELIRHTKKLQMNTEQGHSH